MTDKISIYKSPFQGEEVIKEATNLGLLSVHKTSFSEDACELSMKSVICMGYEDFIKHDGRQFYEKLAKKQDVVVLGPLLSNLSKSTGFEIEKIWEKYIDKKNPELNKNKTVINCHLIRVICEKLNESLSKKVPELHFSTSSGQLRLSSLKHKSFNSFEDQQIEEMIQDVKICLESVKDGLIAYYKKQSFIKNLQELPVYKETEPEVTDKFDSKHASQMLKTLSTLAIGSIPRVSSEKIPQAITTTEGYESEKEISDSQRIPLQGNEQSYSLPSSQGISSEYEQTDMPLEVTNTASNKQSPLQKYRRTLELINQQRINQGKAFEWDDKTGRKRKGGRIAASAQKYQKKQ